MDARNATNLLILTLPPPPRRKTGPTTSSPPARRAYQTAGQTRRTLTLTLTVTVTVTMDRHSSHAVASETGTSAVARGNTGYGLVPAPLRVACRKRRSFRGHAPLRDDLGLFSWAAVTDDVAVQPVRIASGRGPRLGSSLPLLLLLLLLLLGLGRRRQCSKRRRLVVLNQDAQGLFEPLVEQLYNSGDYLLFVLVRALYDVVVVVVVVVIVVIFVRVVVICVPLDATLAF